MNSNVIILFFLLFASSLYSQKVDSLLNLAWNELFFNPDYSLSLAQEAFTLAQENKNTKQIGTAAKIIGVNKMQNGRFDESELWYRKGLSAFESILDSIGIADVKNNLGILEKLRSNYELSVQLHFDAAGIYEENNLPLKLANVYLNIANTFQKSNDLKSALDYHRQSHHLFLTYGDSVQVADAKYSMAADFLLLEKLDSASIYAKSSLGFYNILGFWDGEADALDILAQIAREKREYKLAEKHYQSAIELYEEYGEPEDARLFLLYLNRGGLFLDMEEGERALQDLRRAKVLLSKREEPEHKLRLARGLTDAYAMIGKLDSALLMNQETFIWLDTLEAKSRAEAIAEMQTKYETEKTERELAEEKLESQKATTQRNLLFFTALSILVLSIFGYLNFRQRQKAAATIAEQKEKIHQQEVQELLKTQELIAINSMLEGQEKERLRIAKDLHDRLGSMLTTVKWRFDSFLENSPDKKESEDMSQASSMLDDAYHEVRRISHDLVSGVLTKFGLVPALNELANTISAGKKLQVKIMANGLSERLNSNLEITLYRVIQELLSNILKHSKATECIVQLTQTNGELSVTVEDNGIGFKEDKIKHGMGIRNVEARIQSLDGSVFFDSGKGNGTTVLIEIPIDHEY